MSVTSAYIECATGNWYHRIELTDSFLLKYRYWIFTKITASASRKKFWTSDIANPTIAVWQSFSVFCWVVQRWILFDFELASQARPFPFQSISIGHVPILMWSVLWSRRVWLARQTTLELSVLLNCCAPPQLWPVFSHLTLLIYCMV